MMSQTNDVPVLIIEDDHELGPIFMEILASIGMDGELIQDGQTAYERLKTHTPDLVVIDLHLPGLSGSELMAYIRGEARLSGTSMVVMTADVPLADKVRSMADAVLIKPTSVAQLIETLQHFTDKTSDA